MVMSYPPPRPPWRERLRSLAVGAAIVAIVGGFGWWAYLPELRMNAALDDVDVSPVAADQRSQSGTTSRWKPWGEDLSLSRGYESELAADEVVRKLRHELEAFGAVTLSQDTFSDGLTTILSVPRGPSGLPLRISVARDSRPPTWFSVGTTYP